MLFSIIGHYSLIVGLFFGLVLVYFSAKNFRTWAANDYIIKYLYNTSNENDNLNDLSERNCTIIINKCIDLVSQKLNNTRAICKKSYICNDILDDFKINRNNFIKEIKLFSKSKFKNCSNFETILLKLLKKYKSI